MPDLPARGITPKVVAVRPVILGSDWPRTEPAATIGTDIFEDVGHAGSAEGAFEGADHRVQGIGRQRSVTILACRSEFEHI